MLFQKFDEKYNTLDVKARGNVDYWEVLDLYRSIESNTEFPRKLKIIINSLESKLDFPVEYNDDISKAIKNMIKKYDIIKEAIIVDESIKTSVSLMFDDKYMIENYSFKIFNNLKAAQKWLDF